MRTTLHIRSMLKTSWKMRGCFSVGSRAPGAWIAVRATRVTSLSPLYTLAKIRRANVGSNVQGLVDEFNTQILPLTQSG
jgi:hypothetical protein